MIHPRVVHVLAVVLFVAVPPALAQPTGPRVDREKMWFAPTAEDWKKPCLVHWQRTFDDAFAVAKATGKPILVCINMDGEIASEHYAGVRYRQPDIAAIYDRYVCVIGSVYRHTPRDYDELGRRIPCPRFGTVTCGEHIALEGIAYEKFLDGKRIAPRHIGIKVGDVALQDLKKDYDVYYAWDTDSVFEAVRKGAPAAPPQDPSTFDRPPQERIDSRDAQDRAAVEAAYAGGDVAVRRALLAKSAAQGAGASLDLLRLGIYDADAELASLARRALAKSTSDGAVDLIADALGPQDKTIDSTPDAERKALIAALDRIGETSPRARTLAVVHRDLGGRSSEIDVDAWAKTLATDEATAAARDAYDRNASLARQNEVFASGTADDRVALAEAFLARALEQESDRKLARAFLEDAKRTALEAESLGATGWRVSAAVAVADWHLGDADAARARAEQAVKGIPADAQGWNSMIVLGLFAEVRQQQIAQALKDKQPWPPEWLADVNAAYAVLARHPQGTDSQVAGHVDFLLRLEAKDAAARALDEGLERFPDSMLLHQRLRARLLREKGPDHLEGWYATLLKDKPQWPLLDWYAGYASLIAAEQHRRTGHADEAMAAYRRAVTRFDASIAKNPESRGSADHHAALALAGCARLELEAKDYDRAVADLTASIDRKVEAAGVKDGLSISPIATARTLLARAKDSDRADLAAQVDALMKRVDPILLQPASLDR